jgi:hypothetical protein
MKALASYPPDVAYKTMSEDTTHIIVPLETNALSQGFAQAFQDLLTTIRKTWIKEDDLVLAVARADGHVVAVDADIDVLVVTILQTAKVVFGETSALYLFLLGGQTIGEICEPVLDDELDTVKSWVDQLKACSDPFLQAQGIALEKKIAEADLRVADLDKAEQDLDAFRKVGGRKQLVDSANALRSFTYGALIQLASTPAGAALPPDFTDRVFQHERSRRRRRARSIKALEKLLVTNEKEHGVIAQQIAEAKKAEEEVAKAKAKKKVKPIVSALGAAKKKAAELQAQIDALEAQVPPPSAP